VAHRRGKTIDYKAWRGLPGLDTTFSANAVIAGSGQLAFTAPATILRVRTPDILVQFDETQQVDDEIHLTWGLGVFATDVFAAGSFPDPADEPEYPWLWWGVKRLHSTATGALDQIGSSVVRFSADTKAMRRVHPSQSLAWVLQIGGAIGAPVTIYHLSQSRVLVGT